MVLMAVVTGEQDVMQYLLDMQNAERFVYDGFTGIWFMSWTSFTGLRVLDFRSEVAIRLQCTFCFFAS